MKNKKYKFQKAVHLSFLEGTSIKILFEDGLTKIFDVSELFDRLPEYKCLNKRDFFLKGKLDGWGGIRWNSKIDLGSETIYYEGTTVPSEENAELLILGFKVKQARLEKELTQKQLSDLVNSDQGDISRLEKGQYNPSFKFLEKISKALNKKLVFTLE